jgi:hypothetical protein
MKTFTTLAGLMIGPVVGFYGTYWLYSLGTHHDCMWRLDACAMSACVGVSPDVHGANDHGDGQAEADSSGQQGA